MCIIIVFHLNEMLELPSLDPKRHKNKLWGCQLEFM